MVETYRNIRPDDYDDLLDVVRHWEVVRQLGGWKWPCDPVQVRERSNPYKGNGFVWAICVNDRLIGSIGVTNGDIGYMLRPDCHGRGIMTRAARHAIGEAFRTTDRAYLTGSTWFDNAQSAQLLAKFGFRHWQTRYMHARARGRPTLVHHRKLTRTTWETLEKRRAMP